MSCKEKVSGQVNFSRLDDVFLNSTTSPSATYKSISDYEIEYGEHLEHCHIKKCPKCQMNFEEWYLHKVAEDDKPIISNKILVYATNYNILHYFDGIYGLRYSD